MLAAQRQAVCAQGTPFRHAARTIIRNAATATITVAALAIHGAAETMSAVPASAGCAGLVSEGTNQQAKKALAVWRKEKGACDFRTVRLKKDQVTSYF